MEHIIHKLKKLNTIEPSPLFREKSRGLVLCVTPRPVIDWKSLVWAGVFSMALLLLVVVKTLTGAGSSPVSLDTDRLKGELRNLSINIQLNEIAYGQRVNQTIAAAIDEITNDQIKHLNKNLLESEDDAINLEESNGSEVDTLLEKVLF